MTIDQFTEHLNNTTSSIFSPTPLREPTPPRDPTPIRDESKGKGIATKEPLNEIMSYMEESVKEMKRLADLKAEKEKSKMVDQPITKISYKVSSSKEASMRNVTIYEKFILKTLGFNEWLEKLGIQPPHELSTLGISVDDRKRKRTSDILQEVFVKENIVVDGMQTNLIPPLGIKGSRGQVIREPESGIFYYNGNFDLVFQREEEFHLATNTQLIRLQGAIQRGTPEAEEMFKKMEMTIEARNDVNQARKFIKDNLDGLG
ncbi:hypothetical protein Tco_1273461 [Tanacetum coccineum]